MSNQASKILKDVRPHLAPGDEPLVAIVAQPIISWVPISEADAIEVHGIARRRAITFHVGGQQISLEANAAASANHLASTFTSLRS